MTVLIRTATLPIPIMAMNAVVYESFKYIFFAQFFSVASTILLWFISHLS